MNEAIHRIGVVFIDCDQLARAATKYAILELNRIQRVFDFAVHDATDESRASLGVGVADHDAYVGRARSFADQILTEAQEWAPLTDTPKPYQWLIITEVPLAGNIYLLARGSIWVLSLAHWDRFSAPPSVIEFVLRILQRVALDGVCPRKSHFTSKGCLYDFNASLSDAKYSVLNGNVCPDCRHALEEGCPPAALAAADRMMDRTWLGNRDVPGDPASVLAQTFRYDLYITTGLSPGRWDIAVSKFSEAGIAEIAKYVVVAVVVIVLALIGSLFHVNVTLQKL